MLLQSLGTTVIIGLMACSDRPRFSGPDLSWLLAGPDMDQPSESDDPHVFVIPQQNQPAS